MRPQQLFHLARVRRDRGAAQGWSYASLCGAVPRAGSMHGLTYNPDKATCPQCRRWMPRDPSVRVESRIELGDRASAPGSWV